MRLLIEETYPEHGIFGEEWGEKEVSHNSEGVRYRWILDPVDGTKSFITNSFLFGTLIALERDDGTGFRPILSSISHSELHGSANIQKLIDRVKMYRTMGDCFGYFAVASAGADIMIDPELCYWDVAALLPVVEGAGGVITSMTGGNPL